MRLHCLSARRVVLAHLHIFKNGGTTIESILEREFQDLFSTLHGDHENATIRMAELQNYLANERRTQAISSHHLRFPKPRPAASFEIMDICFLRHPLDRLYSAHSFWRRSEPTDDLTRAAHQLSVRDFFARLLQVRSPLALNWQTRWLGCETPEDNPADEDWVRATRRLERTDILGTVELFDEALVTAEYALAPVFEGLQWHYRPQNVTNSATSNFQQRMDGLRVKCGEALWRDLVRANALDLELWRLASREVLRRLRALPHYRYRLAEYRRRNLSYQSIRPLREKLRALRQSSVARPAPAGRPPAPHVEWAAILSA